MHSHLPNPTRNTIILLILSALILSACGAPSGQSQSKNFTVGIIVPDNSIVEVAANFKTAMTALGYTDKNLTYVTKTFPTPSVDVAKAATKELMDAKVDMILAITSPVALGAKQATAGTDIPVLFAPGGDALKIGLVKNLSNPGENVTGIAVGASYPTRLLEYLKRLNPNAKKVYIMYDPANLGAGFIGPVKDTASKINVEAVIQNIHTDAETTAAIANIPADADAVLMIPEPLLYVHMAELTKATTDRKIPLLLSDNAPMKSGGLLGYGWEYPAIGKQAARLADKILKGAKPGTIPVETAEYVLSINLVTAKAIGLTIDETLLRESPEVIRDI